MYHFRARVFPCRQGCAIVEAFRQTGIDAGPGLILTGPAIISNCTFTARTSRAIDTQLDHCGGNTESVAAVFLVSLVHVSSFEKTLENETDDERRANRNFFFILANANNAIREI